MKSLNKAVLILFQVNLVAYFLFLILNILTQSFVSYYLNFKFWLGGLIILGILILVFKKYSRD